MIGIDRVSECLIGAENKGTERGRRGDSGTLYTHAETMNIVGIKQSHSSNSQMIDGSRSIARIASKIFKNRSLIPTHPPSPPPKNYIHIRM
jgi:hypothetical protein